MSRGTMTQLPLPGYTVRDPEIEKLLTEIGRMIKDVMPPGWGFALHIVSFDKTGLPGEGPHGSTFYISSLERDSYIAAMREFIERYGSN